MTQRELEDTLVLLHAQGLSRRDAGRLIQHAGSPDAVFALGASGLAACGLKPATVQCILNRRITDEIRKETDFVQRNAIRAIGFWEQDYPPLLRECPDAPVMLFGKGAFDFSAAPLTIAMVGTRSITPYGMAAVEDIVRTLAPYRPTIVSGLAYGVDGQAHRMALKYGLPTIGVLGQGLGTPMYPAQNRDTARQMCRTPDCGILSEYQHLQEAIPGLFPARNRIVAGMARATIVVEAKAKGGALITANLACGYNREVFAVPGRMNDPCSAECNALIRENKALITDDPQVILRELGLQTAEKKKTRRNERQTPDLFGKENLLPPEETTQKAGNDIARDESPSRPGGLLSGLDQESKNVAQALLPVEKMHVDELTTALDMPVHRLNGLLLELELAGIVDTLPGKYYALNPAARK